ncbi:hypothetical protein BC833DRAFT_74987 [Globomyces pollinis-pini]|nr:hypothetical protein BC833DRAFT_74987 [Globomyces pollinis-pini]
MFQNIATILNVYQTTQFLFLMMTPKPTKYFKATTYASLALLHFILAGSYYFGFCWQLNVDFCIDAESLNGWLKLYPFWILIMFVWDIVPTFYVGLKLHYSYIGSWRGSLKEIYYIDSSFLILSIHQVILGIVYFLVSYIRTHTNYLGSDKSYDSILGFESLILTAHTMLNILLLQKLGNLVRGGNKNGMDSSDTIELQRQG